MSIVTRTYFKNEIYLPHAKAAMGNTISDIESKVDDFIDKYEQDCLIKSLGIRLATEFFKVIDVNEPSLIKAGSDAKWDNLLNGTTYQDSDGEDVIWKGIRRAIQSLGAAPSAEYDESFLAFYIYFYYEKNSFITRASAGDGKVKAANMEMVTPTHKVVNAWNQFVRMVQGADGNKNYFVKKGDFGGVGADYYNADDNTDVSMYKFINDTNNETEDTYEFFQPMTWAFMTQEGI